MLLDMDLTGNLLKMRSEYLPEARGSNIKYNLPVGSNEIDLSERIGSELELTYKGKIFEP